MASGSVTDELAALLVEQKIAGLQYAYVQCIDDDRLEEWPNFFVDDCIYKIISRENADNDLPLPVLYCHNKDQLRDRVLILRKATVFTLRFDRHVVSNIRVVDQADGIFHVQANCVVYVTDVMDGVTRLFSTGKYDDKVLFVDGEAKFKEKIVVLDTYSIPNHISSPL